MRGIVRETKFIYVPVPLTMVPVHESHDHLSKHVIDALDGIGLRMVRQHCGMVDTILLRQRL